MASRAFSRRLFASALRAPATAARPAAGRRLASTGVEHGAKQSSDMPWMIGSALVFGPIAVYLLSTQGKDKGKHSADAHHARAAKAHAPTEEPAQKEEQPAPEPEPAQEEAPKDEQPAEQADSSSDDKLHGAQPMTDSEGTTASAEEIDASMKQAFKSNIPEDAQRAEENDKKFAEGAPGQTAEAETKPDQKEMPGHHHAGTLQSDSDDGPTNMGDAREKATSKEAPKQAAQDSD
ncbi:hypothetical protein PYCCODRAFT_1430701 [Trametes coccinea BRFM310]|uniref:Uncharacterized protein n=1 Tax=Trametes coccinea (strain BRFM310) TaxID=1353009 RepID=A0A1Y2J2A9_TRAC3|nr:hypothetical protein PYCCODRAFT_1430701 [Trametes coccinea BRFM310]